MVQALMSGVSSIEAQQTQMDVIGNDLANINTTAYKGESANFEDLMAQQLAGATGPTSTLGGTDGIQYGLGVQVGSTSTNMSQGSLNATSNPSDMAIQGNGFFMEGNGKAISYTRDGSFEIDANGNLVSADSGLHVLGWSANAQGVINTSTAVTAASNLTIPVGTLSAAAATQNVTLAGNLNADAASTDSTSVTTTVYNSQGAAQNVTIVYSNPAAAGAGAPAGAVSQWQWTAYAGTSATGTPIGSSTSAGNTPIYFDVNGNMVSGLASGKFNTITIPASGTSPAATMNLNMNGIQQLASPDQIQVTSQDGFPPGTLQSFSVSQNGLIEGTFSNGLDRPLGQIALASFSNPGGLNQTGSNLYTTSPNSGVPQVGVANTGTLGTINSGFLEQSNVDLSTSLTNLIVTQRGFEANTKIITTVDQMMQDLIQMTH